VFLSTAVPVTGVPAGTEDGESTRLVMVSTAGPSIVTAGLASDPVPIDQAAYPSDPDALPVNVTVPAPAAENVQVKVAPAPGPRLPTDGGEGPTTATAAPDDANMVAVIPVASAPPVSVTVIVTVIHCPTTVWIVEARTTPARLAGATAASAAPADADTIAPPHVSPVAVAVKEYGPVPVREYVHARTEDPPPGTVTGPGAVTSTPVPGPVASAADTAETAAPPVFVTVIVTVTHSPLDAAGGTDRDAARAPGIATATGGELAGPLVTPASVLASVPVTVVVNPRLPAAVPE
jgi:hypothetical protein